MIRVLEVDSDLIHYLGPSSWEVMFDNLRHTHCELDTDNIGCQDYCVYNVIPNKSSVLFMYRERNRGARCIRFSVHPRARHHVFQINYSCLAYWKFYFVGHHHLKEDGWTENLMLLAPLFLSLYTNRTELLLGITL